MAYVITQPCIGVKDASCVEVCPVDCIHTDDDADMYYIDPEECIDCGACVDPCPVDAIYPEDEVPGSGRSSPRSTQITSRPEAAEAPGVRVRPGDPAARRGHRGWVRASFRAGGRVRGPASPRPRPRRPAPPPPLAHPWPVGKPRRIAHSTASPCRQLGCAGAQASSRLAFALDAPRAAGLAGIRTYGPRGEARGTEVEVFVQSFAPPPAMYVFGATDFARATAAIGKFLGYRVTVCDARSTFLTRPRFPEADELVVRWPDEFLVEAPVDQRTAICILTHDPKFDVPLLEAALATDAGYIGAMGSRRTDEQRTRELRARGAGAEQLARIRGPIGLDIGARTPQEVAVAIAGEITSTRSGATGGFLRERSGAVHDVARSKHPAVGVLA